MKFFTELFSSKVLPVLACLFLANLFFVEEVEGQCTVNTITTISKNIGSLDVDANFEYDFLTNPSNLGLGCPNNHLFVIYPVQVGGTGPITLDTAYLGTTQVAGITDEVLVTCDQMLDDDEIFPVMVPNGTEVDFIVSVGIGPLTGPSNINTLPMGNQAKVTDVSLILIDNQAPVVDNLGPNIIPAGGPYFDNTVPVTPIVIECSQDTALFLYDAMGNVTGPNLVTDNVGNIGIPLYPTVTDCNADVDTTFYGQIITTFSPGLLNPNNTILVIERKWVFTDNLGNVTDTIRQTLEVRDNIDPIWADPRAIADTMDYVMTGNPYATTMVDPDGPGGNAPVGIDSLDFSLGNGTNNSNGRRLNIFLDLNDPNYAAAFKYWTEDYAPHVLDSCAGVYTVLDTSFSDLITPVSADTTMYDCDDSSNQPNERRLTTDGGGVPRLIGAKSSIRKRWTGMDVYGNGVDVTPPAGSDNFALFIYSVDKDTAEIIQMPPILTDPTATLDTAVVNTNPDTITVFVTNDAACERVLSNASMELIARDTIDKDMITYTTTVTLLSGGGGYVATPAPLVPGLNSAGGTYGDGLYRIQYVIDDQCGNVSTFTFILRVDNHAPVLMKEPDPSDFDGYIPGNPNAGLAKVDTFILFNIPDGNGNVGCKAAVPDSLFDIMAVDTFDGDPITYSVEVDRILPFFINNLIAATGPNDSTFSAINAMPSTPHDFNDSLSVGTYQINYTFNDNSNCQVPGSVSYFLRVVDTASVRFDTINYPDLARFDTINNLLTLTVDATSGACSESVTLAEPNQFLLISNCPFGGGTVSVERKFVSGPDTDVFDGKPQPDGFGPPIGQPLVANYPVGTTIYRYILTNTIGSKDSVDFAIIVTDTVAPVANCPTNITLQRDPITCNAVMANYRNFITDNCTDNSNLIITQNPAPGTPVTGTTTVTLTGSDGANMTSCSFTVMLADLAPVPLVPTLTDTTTQCSSIELVAPQATLCGSSTTIFALAIGGGTLVQNNPRTYIFDENDPSTIVWEFVDPSTTETARQLQTITFVDDTTPPMIVPNATAIIAPDTNGKVIFPASAFFTSVMDNCSDSADLVFAVSQDTLMNCDSLNSTFKVYLMVTDEAGNTATDSTMVTVLDQLAPIFIDVPTDTTLTCIDVIPTQVMLRAEDNCSQIDTMYMTMMSTRADTAGSLGTLTIDDLKRMSGYFNYTITYNWFARDENGNTGFAQQIITVKDDDAPVNPYGDTLMVASSAGATDCSATFSADLRASYIDVCTDTSTFRVDFGDGIFRDTTSITMTIPMGEHEIRIEATDAIGNTRIDTILLMVQDQTDPTPVCQDASVPVNALGYVVMSEQIIDGGSFDNCTSSSFLRASAVFNRDTFRCSDVGGGPYNVVMTVTDEAGNSLSCSSMITIQDFAGTGSFSCPGDVTISCDASTLPSATGTPLANDICQNGIGIDFEDKFVAVNAANICTRIERTWRVTDPSSGTVTTCVQMINLIDNEAPVFTAGHADVTVACVGDAPSADFLEVTDNCAPTTSVEADETIIQVTGAIILRKIWTGTDSCNTIRDTQDIRIVDVTAPAFSIQDTFTYNTGDLIPDSCGAFVTLDLSSNITDCNESLGLTITNSLDTNKAIVSGFFREGNTAVTITARDASGNQSSKTIIIKVNDTSSPTVVCVGNRTISLGSGGTGILQIDDVFSSATDNCDGVLPISAAVLSKTIFDCSDLGAQVVTMTVMDAAGNAGTCDVNVVVINGSGTSVISINPHAQAESVGGANDGIAWVDVTGGSGDYTYLWTPGNATTDTIKNLAAGLYTVVVNDEVSGCRLTDTVRVDDGSTVNYTVCDGTASNNQVVQIPIKVSNFTDIVSMDMSFNIANTNVAQFILNNEAGGFNLADVEIEDFSFISPSRLLFAANLDPTNGETLPDGTQIFYLNLQLVGTGTTTVSISGNSIADIETGALINGSPVIITSGSTTGMVTSTVAGSQVDIGGAIALENGTTVDDVTINLSGSVTGSIKSDAAGQYSVSANTGQSITITPSENDSTRNGLSTFDLVLIQDHIDNRILLNSPYKRLAADVDKSGSISTFDILTIQDVILTPNSTFPATSSWVFVPTSHVFQDMANPWNGSVPTSITVSPSSPATDLSFVAVKTGDVNLDAQDVFLNQEATAESRDKGFQFTVADQKLSQRGLIEVPVKASDFNSMRGYQMTLDFDSDWLSFETIKAGALSDLSMSNFGLAYAEKGQIATNWISRLPLTVSSEEVLFTLVFRVEQTGKVLSELLSVNSQMIRTEAITTTKVYNDIDLVFENKLPIVAGFELFQNKPNPFRNETTVSFSLPEAAPITLRLFDFNGRLVYQVKGDYDQGLNNIVVRKNELAGSGVLYYELATPDFTARKKMIVLE